MPVSKEDVQKTADLARLEFGEDEQERLTRQLSSILDYMEKLQELDTTGVPPMSHVLESQNVFRDDEPEERMRKEEALQAASKTKEGYFIVPRTVS